MTGAPIGLRERKKRETREALARAGLELFVERGYDATTLADIAEVAGVSTRTIFAYFPSKEDILFASFETMRDALATTLAARPEGQDALAALREFILSSAHQKKEFIQPFFSTMQYVMAGNDTEGLRYGTIQTPEKYYLTWKEDGPGDNPLDNGLRQLCGKARFLERAPLFSRQKKRPAGGGAGLFLLRASGRRSWLVTPGSRGRRFHSPGIP